MVDYNEAIKNLQTIHGMPMTIRMAIEALEKQIPKKPLHMHKNYYCPTCKEDGWMLWDDAVPNDMDRYCGKCGQAIEWKSEIPTIIEDDQSIREVTIPKINIPLEYDWSDE